MLIENIGATTTETSASSSKNDDLGRDQFLTLLVAQLQHQDPLNPMESTEFTSQLAQYSSLEQLMNINDSLESLKTSQNESAQLQALNFIGKEIEAKGDMLSYIKGEASKFGFNLSEGGDCTALITDSNGNPVKTLSMGMLETGVHSFEWDGRNELGTMMESGTYGLQITATAVDGQDLPVETLITGRVTGVNFEGTSPILYLGDIPITLSQIVSINAGEGSTEPEEGGDEEAPEVSMEGENDDESTVSTDNVNEEESTVSTDNVSEEESTVPADEEDAT